MSYLGELVKNKRDSLGLTLVQVEEKCGITKGYISQMENGKRSNISVDMLYKMSEMYSIKPTVLLEKAFKDLGYGDKEENPTKKKNKKISSKLIKRIKASKKK